MNVMNEVQMALRSLSAMACVIKPSWPSRPLLSTGSQTLKQVACEPRDLCGTAGSWHRTGAPTPCAPLITGGQQVAGAKTAKAGHDDKWVTSYWKSATTSSRTPPRRNTCQVPGGIAHRLSPSQRASCTISLSWHPHYQKCVAPKCRPNGATLL